MQQALFGAGILTAVYLIFGVISTILFFFRLRHAVEQTDDEMNGFQQIRKRVLQNEIANITRKKKYVMAVCIILFWLPMVIVEYAND